MTQGTTTTESYTYDGVGNRLTSLTVPSYTYNSSNELTATSAATYTYDNKGNTLTKTVSGGTTQYAWDFDNRLTSLTLPGTGGTVTFKYDPFGKRIQKAFNQGTTTTTTNYVYDGANSIEEVDQNANVLARYTQGTTIDEPIAQLRSGAASYYEQDGLGSVTSLSATGGPLANTYVYDSFGNLAASSGTVTNPYQYTGRDYDPETGLRYYRARYYDSSAGRFLSEDPLGVNSDDIDLYRYVHNYPINDTDPDGHGGKTHDCGAGCGFRVERDPHKGLHVNWWCNGLYGCLLIPSFQICEPSRSYLPPNRIIDCISKKLGIPKPKPMVRPSCNGITQGELKMQQQSAEYMVTVWKTILVGDGLIGAVGIAGAFGLLEGGAGGAVGGGGVVPRTVPSRPPIPMRPQIPAAASSH